MYLENAKFFPPNAFGFPCSAQPNLRAEVKLTLRYKLCFNNVSSIKGAVRNADRIWSSTPQNRAYRGGHFCS